MACGVLVAGTMLLQGTVPARSQTPGPPVSNKGKPLGGKWLFMAESDGNLMNFMPTGSEFEPLLALRCQPRSTKVHVYVTAPSGIPAGRRATVRIIRGAVEVAVAGATEDGPSGVALTGESVLLSLADLRTGPGDVLLAFANGTVLKLPEKTFATVYGRFLKSCGVAPPPPAPPVAGTAACLIYRSRVTVTGTVEQRVYPGPPNFESVTKGDRPETVSLLKLATPACVTGDPTDPEGQSPAVASIGEIQLVPKAGVAGDGVSGKTATLSGRLFGAHTGHHRTKVVLDDVQNVDGKAVSSDACDVEKSNQLDAKMKETTAIYVAAEKANKNIDTCAYNIPILFAMRELRAEINKCRGRSDLEERIQGINIITPRLEFVLGKCLKAKGLQ